MATINNIASNTLISGTNGKTINITGGEIIDNNNILISNAKNSVSVVGTGGADSIYNAGRYVTINALGGNDTIYNYNGNYSTIYAGDGDDSVYGNGSEVSSIASSGNETLYYSGNHYVSINGGAGADTIHGSYYYSTILGGASDDMLTGSYNYSTVDGGDGNDTIHSFAGSVNGGAGNDRISITSYNYLASIKGGTGDDTIYSGHGVYSTVGNIYQYAQGDGYDVICDYISRDTISIGGGVQYTRSTVGSDVVISLSDGAMTLKGASGKTINILGGVNNTLISNTTDSIAVVGTNNAESIYNSGKHVTISALGGNDSVYNDNGEYSIIDTGDGYDTINNRSNSATINAGAGDDSIENVSENVLFEYTSGNGNDYIQGFNATSTLSISGGAYSTTKSGSDIIVSVGDGKITLSGAASLSAVHIDSKEVDSGKSLLIIGTEGADSIYNSLSAATINVLDGDDTIENGGWSNNSWSDGGSNVLINGKAGKNYISNHGKYATINGGDDADTIYNWDYSDNTSINGGAGDDFIRNQAANVMIICGVGSDTIINNTSGSNATINGGKGNDALYNSGANVLFQYVAGDGNDLISGFNVLSTLQIGGGTGTYSTVKSGSDVLVNVGSGTITLSGAATLSALNIAGASGTTNGGNNTTPAASKIITLTEGNDTYSNTLEGVTIQALSGNDKIYNDGSGVSINGGSGADSIYNYTGSSVSIDGNAGNDFLQNALRYVKLYGGEGNDTISNVGSYSTIDGGFGDDSISNNRGSNVTISGGAGSDTISNNAYASLTAINGGIGDDSISNQGKKVTIDGGADNDAISNDGDFSTVSGGEGNDYVYNSGSSVSINVGSGNDTVSNYGSDVTIDAAYKTDSFNIVNYGDNVSINSGTVNDTIHNLSGSSVTVNGGSGDDFLTNNSGSSVTLLGGAGNDSIRNDSYASLTVINGGFGDDSISNRGKNATIDGGEGNDTIANSNNSSVSINGGAGNDYIDNIWSSSITINAGSGDDTIENARSNTVIINGGSGNDSIRNYDDSVTIDAGDGNDTIRHNSSSSVTINAGEGDDYIDNSGLNSTINGGAGNDTVYNYYGDNSTINGGAGNDIVNLLSDAYFSKNILIEYTPGDGNDYVKGFNADDTLRIGDGTGGYSTTKSGSDVLVKVGSGTITLAGAASLDALNIAGTPLSITLTQGNDNYTNTLSGATIQALGGDDSIYNGYGNDSVLIDLGAGNDSIYSYYGNYVSINSGIGEDTIRAYGDSVTINGFDGNDYIYSYGADVTLSGDAGNDTINVDSSNCRNMKLNGGAGNDSIRSYGWNVTINGDSDNDSIVNVGSNVTISGDTGDDLISLGSNTNNNLIAYAFGDGNDTIVGYKTSDIVSIGGNYSYTRQTVGSDVVVSIIGGGSMTFSGASDKTVNISGGTLSITSGINITNNLSNTLISGTVYEDTIRNYGSNVTINANDGNDTIQSSNDKVTMSGGAGNDTIIASGNEYSVNGGSGADRISLSGDRLTVKGGAGNDTIYGNTATAHLYQYASGDGNDLIYNWSSNDTLTITGGNNWSLKADGNNVLIDVANSGTISLVGAKGKTVNINGREISDAGVGVTPQDVIKKFMKSLDTTSYSGTAALNQAVSVASGGYFRNAQEAINKMVDDCQNSADGTTFLRDYCDIILDNDDTGAITGSDAGGSVIKTATSIVEETGSVDNFTGNTFTTNGLNVQLAEFDASYGNDYWKHPIAITYEDLTSDSQRYIWQAFKTWWAEKSLNLIAESYGDNYGFTSDSSAVSRKLNFGFFYEEPTYYSWTYAWTGPPYGNNGLTLGVNLWCYNGLTNGGNSDGSSTAMYYNYSWDMSYLDRVLAHEITHAVMMANINYFHDLPQFITEGMAELTHGADDDRRSSITYLSTHPENLRLSLAMKSGTSTVGEIDAYAGGYMFLRYLAKQASEHYPAVSGYGQQTSFDYGVASYYIGAIAEPVTLLTLDDSTEGDYLDLTTSESVEKVDAKALTKGIVIVGNTNANSIATGKGNDTVFANTGNDKLLGGAGNDILYGEAGNDSIKGDAGDDTLCGGMGNDTLTGGKGKDVFIFKTNSGDDLITDYTEGEDKIQLVDGNILASSVSGTTLTLEIMGGSINIKNGKDKKITVIDSDGNETTETYSADVLTLTNSDAAKQTLPAQVITADSTKRTSATRIVGNALDNSILGGTGKDTFYGGNGADYLAGGKGNDKLYGQAGNDTLDGGTGNDYLSGYTGNDSLNGGAGNDTLFGGTGNDTLTGGSGNDLFVYSAGKDVITDYATGDKISINAAVTASSVKGSDATFTIGSNTLTVKDGKGKEVVFIDTQDTERTIVGGAYLSTDSMKSPVTISSWRQVGDASERTTAIKLTGNANDNSLFGGTGKDTLYGKDGDDYLVGNDGNDKLYGQVGNDTLIGGAGNDTLTGGDGNDLFVFDAGNDFISDYATDDKISVNAEITASSVVGSNATFTIGSNTLTVKNGKGAEIVFLDADGNERTIIGGAFVATNSTSTKNTLASWREVGDASARTSAIYLVGNVLGNTLLGGSGKDSLYGKDGDDFIQGNAGADSLYGQNGDDTLWGGIGNDTLKGGDGDDLFIYSGGNDVITDYASGDKISLGMAVTSASLKGSDAILTTDGGKLTIKNAKDLTLIDSFGTEMTTIIGSATYDNNATTKVTLPSGIEIGDASSRTTAIKITGNSLDNSILGGVGKDSLYGGKGNDYIQGGDGNDKIWGQDGNDTLSGGAGNDSMSGGNGANLFIYEFGKDYITDFSATDTLQIGDGTGTYSTQVSGSDIIVTVGDGSIMLKDAASLSAVNILGEEISPIEIYDKSSAAKVTLASGIEVGDASARTAAIRIVGNALDNTIFGGAGKDTLYGKDGNDYISGSTGNDKLYGQNGNDTLWGGSGNDTFTGGAGADTFIYNSGEGKDVISDFSNDDLLQITGTFSATYDSSANTISFKVGSTASAITLKNFTAASFKVNDDSYLISGSKLVTK